MATLALQTGLILLVVFVVLLLLGVPIAVTIALSSVAGILAALSPETAVFTASQRIFTGVNTFSLLAIPFFVLAGNIMNSGGIAIRLVNIAKLIVGRLPGSLAHTNVVGNMLFGSISGSGVAACAAIGGTMNPLEVEAGYLPGILWGLGVMVVAYIIAKRKKYPVVRDKITLKIAAKVIWDALPSLSLIVLIIGGILIGAFTATEGAAIAVVYSFILAFVFYRTIKVKDIMPILIETVKMTGIIIFLIGVSSIMSWALAFTSIPTYISNFIISLSSSKVLIFLLMNIMLLIVGTFMDLTPAVLIFTPILLPIAKTFEMTTIQFGIMIVFNLCIGNITPPVGNTLFVGCRIGKTKIENVIKHLLPFYAAIIIVLMLVTFIPEISLFIPKLCGLVK